MVDGARGRAAGGQHEVGGRAFEGGVQRVGVVAEAAGDTHVGAQCVQPGAEHGAEGVADPALAGQAVGEQFVAEDEDVDAGGRGVTVSSS
ncbi:hypothetical protein GCM10020000_41030 [Streptomyces olivoverticillatus]